LPPSVWNVVDKSEMLPLAEAEFSYYCRVKGEAIPEGAVEVSFDDGEASFTLPKMKEGECDKLLCGYDVVSRLRFLD
ncbi:MAG: hypothetical protein IKB34_08990, partial [Clostridia bacterium]|nr:hypothetical protein [Clostridia bacterium]